MKRKRPIPITQYEQMQYDLGEITLDDIIKKHNLSNKHDERKTALNIIFVAFLIRIWMVMVHTTNNLYTILCFLCVAITIYMLFWNNQEKIKELIKWEN